MLIFVDEGAKGFLLLLLLAPDALVGIVATDVVFILVANSVDCVDDGYSSVVVATVAVVVVVNAADAGDYLLLADDYVVGSFRVLLL